MAVYLSLLTCYIKNLEIVDVKVDILDDCMLSREILLFSFAYLFLLEFSQIDYIYKVQQDSLYFFLEGGFKGIYLRERYFTLSYVVSEI